MSNSAYLHRAKSNAAMDNTLYYDETSQKTPSVSKFIN